MILLLAPARERDLEAPRGRFRHMFTSEKFSLPKNSHFQENEQVSRISHVAVSARGWHHLPGVLPAGECEGLLAGVSVVVLYLVPTCL